MDRDRLWALAERLVALGTRQKKTLGLAESCTGGLLSGAITAIPGASSLFMGAVVSYSNGIKNSLLGVPEEVIDRQGAVSEACARAMASGARRVLAVDLALAVTGIAGPDGGGPEKPRGTVWFALAEAQSERAWHRLFSGNRDEVRSQSVHFALERLVEALGSGAEGEGGGP
ncbi:MAG TPA: CinA family protein [Synergistaceae bacterium]|nr:CinA family protein [Synergistaceae bacterium]HQF90885.1 CinA family protein [Synergistaceae bacterium]HQH78268.1 CinA family protein [Synergistaceae bacterium]HQK25613.1 CinA family protein [Synergistaceae bacterium]